MRWLGLAPMAFHLISMVYFYRIATIRVGFPQWWLAWGILSTVAAAYSWGRARQVLIGTPFTLEAITAPAWGALGMLVFGVYIWHILKPRPSAPPIPVAQVIMTWNGKVISWNATATELLGWTEEEAKDQELATLIIPEDHMVDFHGQQISARDAHRQGLTHFYNTGEAPILSAKYNTVAVHKDGRRLEVEVRVNAHMTSLGTTFLGQIVPKPPLSL